MKSPKELNFAENLMTILRSAEQSGVDIKNVIGSLDQKFKKEEKEKPEPINVRTLVGKEVLYTSAYDYGIRHGKILNVTSKGFVNIDVYHKIDGKETKQNTWVDPSSLYIQEVFDNVQTVPEK